VTAPPRPTISHVDPHPQPDTFGYAEWKDKKCPWSTTTAKGCHKETSFDRTNAKLLIYWRHDIEWAKSRRGAFGQSLVCACSKAARAAGMTRFAIHYWGECWGIQGGLKKLNGGDCVRADFARGTCKGAKAVCLADKHFMVYANGPLIVA